MKKNLYCLVSMVLILLVGMFIWKLAIADENEVSPAQRYQHEKEKTEQEILDNFNHDGENQSEEEVDTNLILWKNCTFEFLSYEIVDDSQLATQNVYKEAFFDIEKFPQYPIMEEYQDREAMKAASPELKDIWENRDNYSMEEIKKIYNDNLDVVEQYTYERQVDKKYVFVKVRITNNTNNFKEVYVNELDMIATNSDLTKWTEFEESIVYFDKPIYVSGDERIHSFYKIILNKKESLECTLGFAVREIEDIHYYIGVVDTEMMETGENYATGKYMLNLDFLNQ